MTRFRSWTLLVVLVVPLPLLAGAPQATERPLKVLFLGDKGHHRPADRAAQLLPVLHDRGIEVTYSERLDDLNPRTLAGYDALLVYANIDDIGPAQEKALLDYVTAGGGFVPLHCASYCFRNSPAYVALVGAQFQRHGTGEFDTKVIDANHPITSGLEPFRTFTRSTTRTTAKSSRFARRGTATNPGRGSALRAKGASSTRPTATTAGPGASRAFTT